MIATRITASAFLFCDDKVLLLKRAMHKELAPGKWASIGGHMELSDITNPRALNLEATCLREVCEETGIQSEQINGLRLRYITIRRDDDEVRIAYFFAGQLLTISKRLECNEGELHWKTIEEALHLPMTTGVRATFKHLTANRNHQGIFLAAVDAENESVEFLPL